MISILFPPWLAGAVGFVLLIGSLVTIFLALLPTLLLKLLSPTPALRLFFGECTFAIASHWATLNRFCFRLLYPMQWEIEWNGALKPGASYLVIANHQSWIDILLIVELLFGRLPFPRFFLKHELKWVPVVGWFCWAMDFPFMKRHTRVELAHQPELRNDDLETTRRACEKFSGQRVTVMNFAEGTRFSESKRRARQSPYRHLLRPKSAGLSLTLDAMGEQFAGILDVTIAYQPSRHPPLWSFLTGEQTQLAIQADIVPVPRELMHGDYQGDPEYRARFQSWLNGLWARKDATLDKLLTRPAPAVRPRMT